MGLWDRLQGIGGAIGGAFGGVGGTIAREAREFGGALLGQVPEGVRGRGAAGIVAPRGVAEIPEFLGAAIGGGIGTALRTRVEGLFTRDVARTTTVGGRSAGSAGLNPSYASPVSFSPTARGGVPEEVDLTFGNLGGTDMAVASALPGGAQVQRAGMGIEDVLGPLIGGGVSALARMATGGGAQVANGGALTLPGAAPGSLYRVVGPALRARSLVAQSHPTTGDIVYWRYVGKAKSFTGDRRIAKGYAKEHGMRLCRSGRGKR